MLLLGLLSAGVSRKMFNLNQCFQLKANGKFNNLHFYQSYSGVLICSSGEHSSEVSSKTS